MFGKHFVDHLITRSAENPTDRRVFLKAAGLAGLGVVGSGFVGTALASADEAAAAPSDGAILNFALNLEYLEAEFYLRAVYGEGLPNDLTQGLEGTGPVTGGRQVNFRDAAVKAYAVEIAQDEKAHVAFLRSALGSASVGRPAIDLQSSFTAAARAAGVVGPTGTFDPFASDENFLLGAYIFEDVGVTAYKGAAPLITNKTYLEAAAGILSVEAYHAGLVRLSLLERGLVNPAYKISKARDSLDGRTNDDQGIAINGVANIVPTDANGITYSRSAGQVLNIVYLTPERATQGGFFPEGVNGEINTSARSV